MCVNSHCYTDIPGKDPSDGIRASYSLLYSAENERRWPFPSPLEGRSWFKDSSEGEHDRPARRKQGCLSSDGYSGMDLLVRRLSSLATNQKGESMFRKRKRNKLSGKEEVTWKYISSNRKERTANLSPLCQKRKISHQEHVVAQLQLYQYSGNVFGR